MQPAPRRPAGDGVAGQVEAAVAELAADPDVHGILVQLPMPAGSTRTR
jgi:5,10-methylene-tetrahydrofolate dehydrogenase/methenyl tetrahydrofolate cyclohydrolase